ncbi:hypothetical protein T484DRAFT_1944636, partial [Baffinella frigidus]
GEGAHSPLRNIYPPARVLSYAEERAKHSQQQQQHLESEISRRQAKVRATLNLHEANLPNLPAPSRQHSRDFGGKSRQSNKSGKSRQSNNGGKSRQGTGGSKSAMEWYQRGENQRIVENHGLSGYRSQGSPDPKKSPLSKRELLEAESRRKVHFKDVPSGNGDLTNMAKSFNRFGGNKDRLSSYSSQPLSGWYTDDEKGDVTQDLPKGSFRKVTERFPAFPKSSYKRASFHPQSRQGASTREYVALDATAAATREAHVLAALTPTFQKQDFSRNVVPAGKKRDSVPDFSREKFRQTKPEDPNSPSRPPSAMGGWGGVTRAHSATLGDAVAAANILTFDNEVGEGERPVERRSGV